jgi:hypothetical protein
MFELQTLELLERMQKLLIQVLHLKLFLILQFLDEMYELLEIPEQLVQLEILVQPEILDLNENKVFKVFNEKNETNETLELEM